MTVFIAVVMSVRMPVSASATVLPQDLQKSYCLLLCLCKLLDVFLRLAMTAVLARTFSDQSVDLVSYFGEVCHSSNLQSELAYRPAALAIA